jgi:polyphosphate glucokinase
MTTATSTAAKKSAKTNAGPITLAIDIGGSGLKAMLLDPEGKPTSERERLPTPETPKPTLVLDELDKLEAALPNFDRVSVGFPGVIKRGVTYTAVNLHPEWAEYPLQAVLEKRWKKPVRVANDAAVQGYGAILGHGVELVLTLGTGMGSALFTGGRLCPGLELGHHPWKKATYEDYIGRRGPNICRKLLSRRHTPSTGTTSTLAAEIAKRLTSICRRIRRLYRMKLACWAAWCCGRTMCWGAENSLFAGTGFM